MPGLTTTNSPTVGKTPIILNSQDDGVLGQIHVKTIRVVLGGNSGSAVVQDRASGGRDIWRSGALNANESEETRGIGVVDGLFATTLPSGGKIYIYYR